VSTTGAIRFARYAFPPNSLHYCGPEGGSVLLEYADARTADAGLVELAADFEAAWPYLELIAGESGIGDPLDDRVVDAYWLGNEILVRIDRTRFAHSLQGRFGARPGWSPDRILPALPAGAMPNHSFHVFGVYPWVGLLRGGSDQPLRILDRCRIRSGVVEAVQDDSARVRYQPLCWDGKRLGFGDRRVETVTITQGGYSLAGPLSRGDIVAMHWDWVCERITGEEARRIERWTASQLQVVNGLTAPGPAAAFG